jgi:2-methylisocitrate lyase-like PEP mutase family enzyme
MMAISQAEKGRRFRALHERAGAFLIPNPWDIGTAHLLSGLGFEALATTSGGHAFSLGKRDATVGRDAVLVHIAAIVSSTDLPVSADLGKGFGDSPAEVARTIKLAAAAGAVGGSIEDATGEDATGEDATGRAEAPIYDHALAVERIQAAVEARRELDFPFTLTARCENFLVGVTDLDATIKRLQAYEQAGADVLFAPGLRTRDQISAVTSSLSKPVNVLMSAPGLSVAELAGIGVKRISVGSALARAAFGAFLRGAREIKDQGTFNFAGEAVGYHELNALFDS